MVAARMRTVVVVVGLLVWFASFWFFDRGTIGWWLVPALVLVCIVGLARQALSDYVSRRAQRDARR
jgi:hypothetical protein